MSVQSRFKNDFMVTVEPSLTAEQCGGDPILAFERFRRSQHPDMFVDLYRLPLTEVIVPDAGLSPADRYLSYLLRAEETPLNSDESSGVIYKRHIRGFGHFCDVHDGVGIQMIHWGLRGVGVIAELRLEGDELIIRLHHDQNSKGVDADYLRSVFTTRGA